MQRNIVEADDTDSIETVERYVDSKMIGVDIAHTALQDTMALAEEVPCTEARNPATEVARVSPEIVVSTDEVGDYLRKIVRYQLLSATQEVELATAIEAGLFADELREKLVDKGMHESSPELEELTELARLGVCANEAMVNSNFRLVVSIARKYQNRGLPLLDLIQEGNLGLMIGVKKFDHQQGNKFSTYATWWIRQSMTRALGDQSRMIRIPVHKSEQVNKLLGIQRDLVARLGDDPTVEQLSQATHLSPKEVKEYLQYNLAPRSLSSPIGEEGDAEYGERIVDVNAVTPEESIDVLGFNQAMQRALDRLAYDQPRGVDILRRRFGLGGYEKTTRKAVAELEGLSIDGVLKLEKQTLETLRCSEDTQHLREYLS